MNDQQLIDRAKAYGLTESAARKAVNVAREVSQVDATKNTTEYLDAICKAIVGAAEAIDNAMAKQ